MVAISNVELLQSKVLSNKFIIADQLYPDSKVHGANMGPIWGRQDPGGPHVGPMNFAIWVCLKLRLLECVSSHYVEMRVIETRISINQTGAIYWDVRHKQIILLYNVCPPIHRSINLESLYMSNSSLSYAT